MAGRDDQVREGEITLPFDPAEREDGPRCVFIGHVQSPWKSRAECPRNIALARARMKERGLTAALHIAEPYRPGLRELARYEHIVALYWMHEAARHIIIQRPRHMPGPRGVFSLRSPARPNPIAMSTVRVPGIDETAGIVRIDAIDCLDGTPLIDIRPWHPEIDMPEGWRPENR
jgi:tRNA-Thr(GGU) m(6)t(6)A37 methyltransferase TsaA